MGDVLMATSENVRATTYLVARERLDKKTTSRKTKRRLECNPPNKQCGGRCIPPEWDCRLEGKGTNSALKVVKSDPLAGAASIQRGATDLAKGVTTLNPSRVQRGRSSIIRGLVKIAPGDGLEDKNKLRRRLEESSAGIFGVTLVGIVGVLGHRGLSTFDVYREGVGGQMDRAATRTINALLDNTPIVSGRRSAVRGMAAMAQNQLAGTLGRQAALTQASNRAATNLGRLGPLGGLGDRINAPNSPILKDAALRTAVRNIAQRSSNADEFAREATLELFSRRVGPGGHTLFSPTAAQTFLNSQFQLNQGSVVNPRLRVPNGAGGLVDSPRANLTLTDRREAVVSGMSSRFLTWNAALRADMLQRGYATREPLPRSRRGQSAAVSLNSRIRVTPDQVQRYIDERALPRVQAQLDRIDPTARGRYVETMRQVLLSGSTNVGSRRLANSIYTQTLNNYDSYFRDVADRMSAGPAAATSPMGDGKVALAKYLRGGEVYNPTRGQGQTRVTSREHADLLIRDWYHRRSVNAGSRRIPPYNVSPGTAQRVAQRIQRRPELPTPEEAISILRRSGLRVELTPPTTPRARARTTDPATPRTPASRRRTTSRRLRSRSELVTMLMAGGRSRSAAENEADAIISRRGRTDARLDASTKTGKPCGKSHIPKEKKCHTSVQQQQPTSPESVKSNKKAAKNKTGKVGAAVTVAFAGAYVTMLALATKEQVVDLKYKSKLAKASINKDLEKNIKPADLSASLAQLMGQPGVNNETIAEVNKFVRKADISVNRAVNFRNWENTLGFWNPAYPSVLNVPELDSRKVDIGRVTAGATKTIVEPNRLGVFRRWGSGSSFERGSSEQNFMTTVHELGHAIHGRGGFKTPTAVTLNGKRYAGSELLTALRRNSTAYGSSDIKYGRYETFAEYFSLYVTSGETLKKRNPVAWAWTKATLDHALAQDPYMSWDARLAVVDIIKRTKNKEKFDASPENASAIKLLRQAQALAVQGKFKELAQAVKDYEGELTSEQFSAVFSLMETATIYAYVSRLPETPEIPEVNITLD
jgi:hypothetical protein